MQPQLSSSPPPQQTPADASIRIATKVVYNDLDSNMQAPLSSFARWALDARAASFAVPPIAHIVTAGTVMVKSQIIHMLTAEPVLSIGSPITVTQVPLTMGRTSFSFQYEFVSDSKLVARATVLLVKVENGASAPLPEWMRAGIAWQMPPSGQIPPDLSIGAAALAKKGPSGRSIHRLITRPSDEDSNQHVNHARFMAMFEDAIANLNRSMPDILHIEYLAQLHRNTECFISCPDVSPDSHSLCLFMCTAEDTSKPVCQAYAQWTLSAL